MYSRHLRNRRFESLLSVVPIIGVIALGSLCLTPMLVQAQTAAIKCSRVLTAAQVRAAVGATLKMLAQQKSEPGVSECNWSGTDGTENETGPTIRVQFFDRSAISANPVASSPDGYYEMIATAAEEIAGRRREVVAGLTSAGSRAATVQGSAQILVLVQRGDGIARVVLGNLTRAQAIAVARTIAAP